MANDGRSGVAARILRREATDLDERRLSKGQRKAIAALLDLFEDALRHSHRDFEVVPMNRLILLDGDRGSGKSTIVHTLRHWMDPEKRRQLELDRYQADNDRRRHHDGQDPRGDRRAAPRRGGDFEGWENDPLDPDDAPMGSLARRASRWAKTVDWLEPLSLDPIAPATNLTAAILARALAEAESTIGRGQGDRRHGVLDEPGVVDRALHELDALRGQAVMALESNLAEYAPQMDPEGHATQVNDVEVTKLNLSRKLSRVLGDLLAGIGRNASDQKGVYVLAIEDLDMRPGRAAEVLRLVYSLKVPRLVVLLVGSADRLEEALRLAFERELMALAEHPDAEEIAAMERKATELAASSFRKMLPLHHRIRVEDMDALSAMSMAVGRGDENRTLEAALKRIGRVAPDERARVVDGSREMSLYTLLNTPFYTGAEVLRAPPRNVVDLADAIAEVLRIDGSESADRKRRAAELVKELSAGLAALVDEDAELGREVQLELRRALRLERDVYSHGGESETRTTGGESSRPTAGVPAPQGAGVRPSEQAKAQDAIDSWELAPPEGCGIHFDLADDTEIAIPAGGTSSGVGGSDGAPLARAGASTGLRVHARFAHIEDVQIGVAPRGVGGKVALLGHRSEAMFKLVHDIIRLGFGRGDVTRPIRPAVESPYAATCWALANGRTLRVPWVGVSWATFLHRDAFASVWNEGIDAVHRVIAEDSELRAEAHAEHALLVVARGLLRAVRVSAGEKCFGLGEGVDIVEEQIREPRPQDEAGGTSEPEGGSSPAPHPPLPEWCFKGDAGAKIGEQWAGLLGEWRKRYEHGHDDPLAAMQLGVLVDVACLCTPEVWPGSEGLQLGALAAVIKEQLAAAASEAAIVHVRETIRHRRLDRVATSETPLLAAALLAPTLVEGAHSPTARILCKLAPRGEELLGEGLLPDPLAVAAWMCGLPTDALSPQDLEAIVKKATE